MALIRGCDVSGWQSVHNWAAVAKGIDFCLIKATESTGYVSASFAPFWAGSRAAGILTGSYHFAQVGNARAEARHYVDHLRRVGFTSGRDLPPMLDLERDGGKSSASLSTWCHDFLDEVDGSLGLTDPWLRCGVYVNGGFRSRITPHGVLEGRWLMYAAWPSAYNRRWPPEHARPAGAAIWQFTDSGIGMVSGIGGGGLDLDVAREQDLRRMAPTHYGQPLEDDMQLADQVEFIGNEAKQGFYGDRTSMSVRSLLMHAAVGGRQLRYAVLPALADIQDDIGKQADPSMSDAERQALADAIAAKVDALRVTIDRELADEEDAK